MSDPAPMITPYRVLGFLIALCNGLALMDVVPIEIKPWLGVGSLVLGLAIAFFFNVPAGAPANLSVAQRLVNKVSDKS